jgi:hypothetical protein
MLDRLLQDLLKARALGAGYEDAAAAIRAEIAHVEGLRCHHTRENGSGH